MNLNGDEERIQRLFREMSLEDTRQTPQFARVVEAAISRSAQSKNNIRPMRLVVVVATMILVVILGVFAVRPKPAGVQGVEEEAIAVPAPQPAPGVNPPDEKAGQPVCEHRVARRVRHRRPISEPALDVESLFAWQSPTASLLSSTADDLLMSLPRVGDSLESIKYFSPDSWN